MSYFSGTFSASLGEETQAEFAARTEITPSNVSRYCGGNLRPTHKRLVCIMKALPDERRLPLLIAYLRDEALVGQAVGIGPADYTIDVAAPAARAARAPYPPGLEEDFETILRHLHTPGGAHYVSVFKALAAAFRADVEAAGMRNGMAAPASKPRNIKGARQGKCPGDRV